MIRLYGVARSRAARNIWLLEELAQPWEHVPVIQSYRLDDPEAAGAPLHTLSPEFLAISPAGAVPVLDDAGFVLSESVAINLYLAAKYDGGLGPESPEEAAEMMQWGLYGATAVEAPALAILYVHGDGRAKTPDGEVEIAVAREKLRRPLAVIEAHLAARSHLVGGRFTVADINLAEMVRYAQADRKLMNEFPAVSAWMKSLHTRPAFKKMWAMRMAEAE